MTLAIVLLTDGASIPEATRLASHLRATVPPELPLVLVNAEADEAAGRPMTSLAATSHAQYVALSQPRCSAEIACGIARRMTGTRHVLLMRPYERLVVGALPRLAAWLKTHDPELALLAGGWWLTEPQVPRPDNAPNSGLAYPDAARLAALSSTATHQDLLALTPDPRRLLLAKGCAPETNPFVDPSAAWVAWENMLSDATPAIFSEPVLLRPLPETGAAPAIFAARDRIQAAPSGARAELLVRMAPWLGDALALSPAHEAAVVEAALHGLWKGLPRRLRTKTADLPGPVGDVFAALARGQSLAALALLATARQERLTVALAAQYHGLRADLDLALPGPEYLANLYARIRGL